MVLEIDKGNATVLLDGQHYLEKANAIAVRPFGEFQEVQQQVR